MNVANQVLVVVFVIETLIALLLHLGWFRERLQIRSEAHVEPTLTNAQRNLARVFVHVEFFRFTLNLVLFLVALGLVFGARQALYLLLLLPLASIASSLIWLRSTR